MSDRDWFTPPPRFSDDYVRTCHLQKPTDTACRAGFHLTCDFHFGGKPKAVCQEVLEEGSGRSGRPGKLRVKLTETIGAYRKGEILEITCFQAVPSGHIYTSGYFLRVRTNYYWTKTPKPNEDSNRRAQEPGHHL